jgi:hypothetical protein
MLLAVVSRAAAVAASAGRLLASLHHFADAATHTLFWHCPQGRALFPLLALLGLVRLVCWVSLAPAICTTEASASPASSKVSAEGSALRPNSWISIADSSSRAVSVKLAVVVLVPRAHRAPAGRKLYWQTNLSLPGKARQNRFLVSQPWTG